jgi:hypothetical protein
MLAKLQNEETPRTILYLLTPPSTYHRRQKKRLAAMPRPTTSYKDTLNNHTTNKDESDWEVDSDASSYDNASYSTTETLTSLQRTQQLSNNILRSKKGQNKEIALTFSSSDSSASDVTGNTNELLKALPKSKSTLTQVDTAPHTLSNNKSPPSKEYSSETSSKGDQTTTATGKEPPLPIGEDTDTFMSNTSSPAKEDRMDSYPEGETPTHTPTTNKSPPTREAHTDPPLEDTVMTTTNENIHHAAALSTATEGTASTSSITTTTSGPPTWQSIMDAANSSLAAQRSYDYLRDRKFGKFPKTPAWKTLSERHKTQNNAFTHFEGIIDQNTVDDDSIQDGIILNFGPAAKKYFTKSWKSPDMDTTKLAELSRTLMVASEPIYQDARNILIKLAQLTPEVFNDNWSYTTGYITNCKEGTLWQIANLLYGSNWVFQQQQLLPKPKPKTKTKKRTTSFNIIKTPKQQIIKGAGVFLSCPKGDDPTPTQSLAADSGKAPRPYHTFFTLVSPVMTSGGTEGETQLLESFHLAMEILLDADKSLVIYVWPKKLDHFSRGEQFGSD